MSFSAALLFYGISAALIVDSTFLCPHPVTCSCDLPKRNYTFCAATLTDVENFCKTYSVCEKCKGYLTHCEICRNKFDCINEANAEKKLLRTKRQYAVTNGRQRSPGYLCPELASPKLGSIRCSQERNTRTCQGTCLPGYRFENGERGDIVLTCQRGRWRPLSFFPACESEGLCDLELSGGGSFNCTAGITGTRCDIICNGRQIRRHFCYPGRNWEPPLPYCIHPKETSANSRNPCRCENGGSCDQDGYCVCPDGWTGNNCETEVREGQACPDPGFISDGDRTHGDGSPASYPETFQEGSTVVYSCTRRGTFLEGRPMLTCLSDGSWSFPIPRCVRPSETCRCQNGGSCDERGNCICPPRRTGTYCETIVRERQSCPDPGFVTEGDRMNSDGTPSAYARSFQEGESVVFSCNRPGYALQGSSLLTCLSDGTWSASRPRCVRPSVGQSVCRNPGTISNGQRLNTDGSPSVGTQAYNSGQSVVYTCYSGYALEGSSILTCLSSGQWSSARPYCRLISNPPTTTSTENPRSNLVFCSDPGTDPNGEREIPISVDRRTNTFPQGTQLSYSCKDGYELQGEEFLFCLLTGEWSSSAPTCEQEPRASDSDGELIYCENPGPISNGRVVIFSDLDARQRPEELTDPEYPQGTRIRYSCEEGFLLRGASTLICEDTGFWSADPPSCFGDCGRNFLETTRRILHGTKTVAGEWPWTVAIAVERNGAPLLICGGALLNRRTVLTAAHCLDSTRRFILYFGKYYRRNSEDDAEVVNRTSTQVIIHPNYDNETYDSDIAVIRFNPSITFTDRIQPICLPTPESTAANLVSGKRGFVTGWGLTERFLPSDELLMANLPVLSNDACMEAYANQNLPVQIRSGMFCAGFEQGRSTACTGDSGSPMVFYDGRSTRYIIEGLVSFGVSGQCGLPGRYTVFTRVSEFLPWIIRQMAS